MQWYYAENEKQQGPVEFEQLAALVQEGRLKPEDLVWTASMGDQWAKAGSVPGLFNEQPPTMPVGTEPLAEWSDSATFSSQTPNRDLMTQARIALDRNWGKAIGGLLIFLVINIGLSLIPFLGGLISFVISGPLMLGWTLFFLVLSRQQPAEVGQIFEGFKQFGNAFVAYLLIALLMLAWSLPAIVVTIAVFVFALKEMVTQGGQPGVELLWFIPLIFLALIPALIAQFRYSQTYYILNDFAGVGPLEAIRRSTQMMKGNKWKLFCLQFRFIGWAFLCVLTFGIGFLWLAPYMMVSMSRFYDDVKGQ